MDLSSTIRILLLIGTAQGFFLSLVLLTLKRGNKRANRIMALIILLFTIMILPHTKIEMYSKDTENLWGEYFIHMLFFLLPPLIYYYVKSLTNITFSFTSKNLIHFVPFSFFLLTLILLRVLNASDDLLQIMGDIMTVAIVLQLSFYLFYSIRLLRVHRENIKLSYSYIEKVNLNWLRFLLWGQIVIWPFFLLVEIINFEPRNYIWILLALFIYLMGYFGLIQPEIFVGIIADGINEPDKVKKKYAKSALTPEMADEYYCRLIRLMKDSKPYLQNNLTLQSLAGHLSISGHHLSQVINEKCGQNFFEYINGYRVEEAKTLLLDSNKDHLSVAAIGYEAGFNSITSFNTIFKRLTNTTPSRFRKTTT
jgi:AraC-like DNA-binding protein